MVGSEHEQLLEQNLLECKLALVVLCVEVDKLLVGTLAALLLHCTGKEVGTDNHTLERWRCLERSVLHITGLVAEDCAEQLLLRSRVAFSLRGNLSDQNITFFYMCAYSYHSVLVKILGSFLTYVRNIPSQFFQSAFCFSDFGNKFINVN